MGGQMWNNKWHLYEHKMPSDLRVNQSCLLCIKTYPPHGEGEWGFLPKVNYCKNGSIYPVLTQYQRWRKCIYPSWRNVQQWTDKWTYRLRNRKTERQRDRPTDRACSYIPQFCYCRVGNNKHIENYIYYLRIRYFNNYSLICFFNKKLFYAN